MLTGESPIYTIQGFQYSNFSKANGHDHRVRWGEFANGDPRVMENILSRSSVGCIAAMDAINPRVFLPGQEPWQGVELKIRWPRVMGTSY